MVEERGEARHALSRRQVLAAGAALPVGGMFWLQASAARAQPAGALQVEVRTTDVPQAVLDAVREALRGGRGLRVARDLRVISVRTVDPEEHGKSAAARTGAEGRWRATAYDYANQRTIVLEGRLGDTTPDREVVTARQPIPSPEEWADARETLLRHGEIGPRLRAGDLFAYRPMPPVVTDGRRRLVTVGLLPRLPGADGTHEIVGVDLAGGPVRRFAARAPGSAAAGFGPVCGAPPGAGQETTGQGLAGQYDVAIRRGGVLYWNFTAVRPSASSGVLGSGVELRDVRYRGRKVLSRAHLPILNVKYEDDACGPFRDWQYQEGMLKADGTDVAPGLRRASSRPTTIIQNGTDKGNFLGAAGWVHGDEVTLMAELEAGWYRYVSQWTFHVDGTIQPRFGFAAVQNSCVCNVHHHHAYWRFNFDIGSGGRNFVRESSGSGWRLVPRETVAFRDARFATRWQIGNRDLRAKYEIRPSRSDGRAKASPDWPFPRGDLWFLRYRPGEIDDGFGQVEAGLDRFVQNQSMDGVDLVTWYASHFTHDEGGAEESGGHGHVVGPDLVPVDW